MKLAEIFEQLSSGELRQLSIGGEAQGVINFRNQRVIARHVNLGLTNLFTRFPLREGQLKLVLMPGIQEYHLKSAFAQSNTRSKELIKYIDDVGSPFKDDLAKVHKVQASTGEEFSLNDKKDPLGLSTPKTHVLRVPQAIVDQGPDLPDGLKTDYLDVTYRATHPLIDTSEDGDFDADMVDIELPYPYLEPLLYFVASRVNPPTALAGESNVSMSYASLFEASCQRLENNNLAVDQGAANDRLTRNGWV